MLSPATEALRGAPASRFATGAGFGGLAAANAAAIVALWLRAGGLTDVHGTADGLASSGRLAGLLGAYAALLALLLLARVPALERLAGFGRLTTWHRHAGRLCLALVLAHTVLTTAGLAVGDRISLVDETARLISQYPGVITATAGLVLLVAVAITSAVAVRRRLRYESWYFVHLYAYLAIALGFSHQLATGKDFVGAPAARAYWVALYAVTVGALLLFRVARPLAMNLRHRLRVQRVVEEAPDVVSIEISGRHLQNLGARPGQFFLWRFLTAGRWSQAHPFSLSAAPDRDRLRITVAAVGDFTAGLRELRPGTRVVAEGPYGVFTAQARRRPRAVLIADGTGITAIRALLETMTGDTVLVYRPRDPERIVFRRELDELAAAHGARVHYLVDGELPGQALARLVDDVAQRDAFVCGSPASVRAVRASLQAAGVSPRQIFSEGFGL